MTSRIDSPFIMSVQVTRRGFPTGKKSEKQRFARGRQPQNWKNSVSPAGDSLKIRKTAFRLRATASKLEKQRFARGRQPQNQKNSVSPAGDDLKIRKTAFRPWPTTQKLEK